MRPKSMLLLALALGCGLVASIGINQYMQGQKADPNADANKSMLVVASAEIPRGVLITQDKLTLKSWPADNIPPGALNDPQKVVGRVATQKLFPGDLVLEAKLAEEGKTRNIPDGMRLVTIKVNYWSVASCFVRPDDRVDVTLVHQDVAQPILENVVVWAVDQDRGEGERDSSKNAMGAQGVTLLVTAEQAVMLALTQQQGQLWLSIRSETDVDTGKLDKIDLARVLQGRAQSGTRRDPGAEVEPTPDQKYQSGIGGILENLKNDSSDGGARWTMKIMVGPNVIEEREYQLSAAN